MNAALVTKVRPIATLRRYRAPMHPNDGPAGFYLASRAAYDDAADLMARFGDAARDLATARAAQSRIRGNLLGFCHWRQIERAIAALSVEHVTGTVH